MGYTERVIGFIYLVLQLAADPKSMDNVVSGEEVAMTALCGLPSKLDLLIISIDVVADDYKFPMDLEKSRVLQ